MSKPNNGQHQPLESTEISGDQVAVVFDPDQGYQILLPRGEDDAEIPEAALALIAAGVRLSNDRDFYDDVLTWWEAHHSDDEVDTE